MSQAYSKWDTLDEAFACIGRLLIMNPREVWACMGIVIVNDKGRYLTFPINHKEVIC